jgi:putative phage-type endonuclease
MTIVQFPTQFTIGGSEAAAAAGIDPHRSRVALWLEKTGRAERPETEAMRWGTLLEPVIRAELRERGYTALPCGEVFCDLLRDPERPWLTGHPDGLVHDEESELDGALLEVKTVGQWAKREWNGEPPAAYVAQVQHYLHLTGLDRALLAVLVGGQKLELTTIDRNQRAIDLLLLLEEQFYGFLQRDELPPPDGSDSAREALNAYFAEATPGRAYRFDKDGMALYRELIARREQEKAVKVQRVAIENRIKALMGDAEVALSPHDDELIRWPTVSSTRVDVTALRAEHPEIAEAFGKTTTTRRFEAL